MQRADSTLQKTIDTKIVLLGSQGVGKSSLVQRYTQGKFSETVTSTIGASFFTHKLNLDGYRIKCQIWDTAGQERFRSMAPMYYRGAQAAMLVYDITNPDSFSDLNGWVKELQRNSTNELCLCLVGNKTDIRGPGSVTFEQGKDFADSIGAFFFETSAKEDTGITDAFLATAKELLRTRATREKAAAAAAAVGVGGAGGAGGAGGSGGAGGAGQTVNLGGGNSGGAPDQGKCCG